MAAPIIALVISAVSKVAPGLGSALGSIKSFVSGAMNAISSVFHTIVSGAKWAAGVIGTIGATLAYFVKGFMTAEKASFNLEQTVKQVGKAAGYTEAGVKALVKELMGISAVDKETMEEIVDTLIRGGDVKPEKIKEYAIQIMNLARATGDMEGSLRFFRRYISDPIDSIALLNKKWMTLTKTEETALKKMEDMGQQEAVRAFLREKLAFALDREAKYVERLSGKWDRLKISFSALREEIGAEISRILDLKGVFDRLKVSVDDIINSPAGKARLTEWLEKNLPIVKKFLNMIEAVAEQLALPTIGNLDKSEKAVQEFKDELAVTIGDFFDLLNKAVENHGGFFVTIGFMIGEGILKGMWKAFSKLPDLLSSMKVALGEGLIDTLIPKGGINKWAKQQLRTAETLNKYTKPTAIPSLPGETLNKIGWLENVGKYGASIGEKYVAEKAAAGQRNPFQGNELVLGGPNNARLAMMIVDAINGTTKSVDNLTAK